METRRIKIGDIIFNISMDRPVDSVQWEEYYNNFFWNEGGDVIVHGCYSGIPDAILQTANVVFDPKSFWTIGEVNGRTVFEIRPSGRDCEPFSIGIWYPESRRLEVFSRAEAMPAPQPLAYPMLHLLMITILGEGLGALVHACGVAYGSRGFLFVGSSGTGKTAMARLWERKSVVLQDERILLTFRHGHPWIFGTPWHGEYRRTSNQGVPLEKIFFLGPHGATRVKSVGKAIAMAGLFSHCFAPYWDQEAISRTLDFLGSFVSKVPCYELSFQPQPEITDYLLGVIEA